MASKLRLEDKVAIVTGAGSVASGSGTGVPRPYCSPGRGPRSCCWIKTRAAAEETGEMIRKEGGTAEVFVADVSRADDCRAGVERAVALWGSWILCITTWASAGAAPW